MKKRKNKENRLYELTVRFDGEKMMESKDKLLYLIRPNEDEAMDLVHIFGDYDEQDLLHIVFTSLITLDKASRNLNGILKNKVVLKELINDFIDEYFDDWDDSGNVTCIHVDMQQYLKQLFDSEFNSDSQDE